MKEGKGKRIVRAERVIFPACMHGWIDRGQLT